MLLIRGALVLVFRVVFGLGTMLIVLAAVLDAWDALLRVVWLLSFVAFIAGNGLAVDRRAARRRRHER